MKFFGIPRLAAKIRTRRLRKNLPCYRGEKRMINKFKGIETEKMQVKIINSLAKVFEDEICGGYETSEISCLKNGRTSFQAVILTEDDEEVTVACDCGLVHIYEVRSVPASYTVPDERDDYYLKNARPGDYPDILRKYAGKIETGGGKYKAVWFELDPNGELDAGDYEIGLTFAGSKTLSFKVKAHIADVVLPRRTLICTHWFHSDCLSSVYNVPVFSEEYWRIVENYMTYAVRHGMNAVLTPLFTPPLDTEVGGERPTVQLVDVTRSGHYEYSFSFEKLQRWVDTAKRAGFEYFEMSHLFTQWGAAHAPKVMARTSGGRKRIFGWETDASGRGYTSFLRSFAPKLREFIDENGIHDRCIFHTSDEPELKDYAKYKKAASLMNELFGDFYITDAIHEPKFYRDGLSSHPITNINRIDKFYGMVPDLWAYYCCNPCDGYYPNRFFAMPSLRNRVLGFILYKYDIKGFLHWAYNFYYTQYSKGVVDPFTQPDAGGNFPAGDSYVVYPGEDGNPIPSLRLKVFYEALEDFEALRLLERLTSREEALKTLELGLDKPITATCYPHSEEWVQETRNRINNALEKASKQDRR